MKRFAWLFGLDDRVLHRDYRAFSAYCEEMRASTWVSSGAAGVQLPQHADRERLAPQLLGDGVGGLAYLIAARGGGVT